jgi:hypothetical protein
MIKSTIGSTQQAPLSKSQAEELKFNLYLKNRKVEEISKILGDVLLWPKANRKKWAKKFSPDVEEMLNILLDDAMFSFDGAMLDKEMMRLFAKFTENLKTVTRQVHGVTDSHEKISA